jgi:PTH1 family peptidyl-tRNA hydrolase
MQNIKLIVGLANINMLYTNTKHNMGQTLICKINQRLNCQLQLSERNNCYVGSINIKRKKILIACSNSYINNCGPIVERLCNFYKLKSQEILIVHDDINIQYGYIKIKKIGGYDGHNGIHNITKYLKTNNFCRLRLGVGNPKKEKVISEYILSAPHFIDKIIVSDIINITVSSIELIS